LFEVQRDLETVGRYGCNPNRDVMTDASVTTILPLTVRTLIGDVNDIVNILLGRYVPSRSSTVIWNPAVPDGWLIRGVGVGRSMRGVGVGRLMTGVGVGLLIIVADDDGNV